MSLRFLRRNLAAFTAMALLHTIALADQKWVVALLKSMPVTGDVPANYAVFEKYARQAAAGGASMIITPECYLDGYLGSSKVPGMTVAKLSTMGEKLDGPWVTKTQALAKELKIYILMGFSERRGDKNYNTIAIIAPDGKLAGHYEKSHAVAGGELYDRGTSLPVFDTPLGRMGVLICFDRQPPENARTLALKGAQFIVVPAYGEKSTPVDEDILMRARAYENGIYVVYTSPRNAFVADPDGEIVAQVRNNQDELLIATLELDGRIGDRHAFTDRQPELYGQLVKPVATKNP